MSAAKTIQHPKSNIQQPPVWRADLALAFNTLIWGSTFVMVKRALDDASAILYVAIRFLVATLVLAWVFRHRGIFGAKEGVRMSDDGCRINPAADATTVRRAQRQPKSEIRHPKSFFVPGTARGGVLAGVCLFGGYAFQTAGLKLTTPSKAAFLTGLSVVLVPLLNSLVYRVYPHASEAIGVVVATVGMGLMTIPDGLGGVARGDILVVLCAVAFAAHIVVLGHYSRMAPFEPLAVWQLGTTAALALGSFWWLEKPFFHPSPFLWMALLVSSLLSTALAFTVMAWAQQVTTATRAALIFALEPVVAWAFSFMVMGERLPPRSVWGAVLILGGILVAELKPFGLERHPSN